MELTKDNLKDMLEAKELNNVLFNEKSYNDKKYSIEEFHKVNLN